MGRMENSKEGEDMTREEWKEVLDGAIKKAQKDWYDSTYDGKKEGDARLCMMLLYYIRESL